jgi:hypothetical protein
MKPFDLEKALAGEPVVTRTGMVVKELIRFKTLNDWSVFAVVGNCVIQCNDNGQYSDCEHNSLDLFMAEKPKVKKEGWVNVYSAGNMKNEFPALLNGAYAYASKMIADMNQGSNRIACVKIEWEEEAE